MQVQYCVLAICRSDNFLGLFRLGRVSGGKFLAFLASLLMVLRPTLSLVATWAWVMVPSSLEPGQAKSFFLGRKVLRDC